MRRISPYSRLQSNLYPFQATIDISLLRVTRRKSKFISIKLEEVVLVTGCSPTIGTVITYPVIEPGENTFMVRALTNEGKWSQSLNLLISIKPRFHQTVPFRIAIGALVILVVVVIIYWVMRAKAARLLRMEFERQESNARIRKEIARDFHDETGNQLSLIITYSSLLRSRKDRPVSDITLQQIEESAQKLYYGTKDFIWSIDPVNDEVSNLFIHIRDLGEKLFETTSTTFRAINSVTESIQLPIGTSRQISLIFREAMNNAFKYASAKNVTFTVSVSETEVQCGIEDDGVGFDFNDLKKTSGLDNMRFRAARMKAQMDMDSFPGKGTTIILRYAR